MNTTPNANRKHIGIYGNTNSGKSSLMNKILGQDISLVSNVEGTTTDPVQKAMELIPFGPVLLIDTAGLEDKSQLGEIRVKKSFEYLKRLDFAIYVVDGKNLDVDTYKKWKREANKYNIKHMVVVNKLDRLSDDERSNINNIFDKPLFISAKNNENIDKLKDELIKSLEQDEEDKPIVGDLLPYGSNVVLVVPIDSEAPKGRIILPQVQVIRDCLDHGIKTYVVRDTELEDALKEIKNIDLVISTFKLKLLCFLGFTPRIMECVNCKEKNNLKYFSLKNDGFKCENCGRLDKGAISISESTVSAIRYIVMAPAKKLFSFSLKDESLNELKLVSKLYFDDKLER